MIHQDGRVREMPEKSADSIKEPAGPPLAGESAPEVGNRGLSAPEPPSVPPTPPTPIGELSAKTEVSSNTGIEGDEESGRRGPRSLGVRLRKTGQVFFFPDEEHTVRIGSKVIVELEHGPALGEVDSIAYGLPPAIPGEDSGRIAGRVVGLATAQDIALSTENNILCAEAAAFCKSCIRQRKLDMKLVDVEVLHDRSKIIFFFTAPARIDFRELVKDLVRTYRTRIELRQIGVRHETQMIGGIGNCGMVCCCHRYLRKFAPVTIKMAKEQNLFLNPAKLSGMCGRLLCCLSFEQGNYEEFNRRCPKLGKKYVTDDGTVKVLRANVFSQSIAVLSEAGEESEMSLEDWDRLHPRRVEPHNPETGRPHAERATGDSGRRGRHDRRPPFEKGAVSGSSVRGQDRTETRARTNPEERQGLYESTPEPKSDERPPRPRKRRKPSE